MLRVALIHKHYRPNHLAQARALEAQGAVDLTCLELTSGEIEHTWARAGERPRQFQTLLDGCFEALPQGRITETLLMTLRALQPDAVIIAGYNAPALRAAARWAKAHNHRSVLLLSAVANARRRWPLKERVKSWFIRRHFDAAFVGGRAHREYLERLGFPGDRVWEGYEVVDNDAFQRGAQAARVSEKTLRARMGLPERYFLFVGRFHPRKNLERLLDAYQCYRATEPGGWGLVLVGDGPLRSRLQRRSEHPALRDVIWAGYREVEELPAYYGLAKAVVLPSVEETWGLPVNEAMACALPVLVSDRCGCAPDLVEEGRNGYRFNPYDVGALVRTMGRLASLDDQGRETMGRASRESIERYTLRDWTSNFLRCLSSVRGGQRPAIGISVRPRAGTDRTPRWERHGAEGTQ